MGQNLFNKCARLARDLVVFDESHPQRHFSFLCIRNKIIATGMNDKWRTSTLANKFGHRFSSIHSEIAVIKNCPVHWRELPNLTMVNVRLNRNLELMLAKPCKCCATMLDWFEVGSVWYSTNLGTWEKFV